MNAIAARIDALACGALAHEVALEGKPGLVTPGSRGSHADMDHRSFSASIDALAGYFGDCARLGAARCGFAELQARGRRAEQAMFAATAGINTHKGAIFTLGLLAAAAGRQFDACGNITPSGLGDAVAQHWGGAILIAGTAPAADIHASHGARLRGRDGLPGAREQAAAGFPVLFATTLPQLEGALGAGATPNAAALQALLATIAVLPDTNLAHRGGLDGLRWAQGEAARFVARGGVFAPGWRRALDALGAAFVDRWLSPGGSADLLAAALLLRALRTCIGVGAGATPDAVPVALPA